jgi:aminoglycoside phosphotransferase (APT) family kinase protein
MPDEMMNRLPAFHQKPSVAEVEQRAMALWPQIAADAGLPPDGAAFSMMQVNSSRQDSRAVLGIRTADERRFVLRADFAEANLAALRAHHDRHRAAAQALREVQGVNVPELVWLDPERPIALFEFAPGETAYRELSFADHGLGNREVLLRRIGGAVAQLHAAGAVEQRRFWPKPHLARVQGRAAKVRAGDLQIRRSNRFLGLCAMLHRFAREARGLPYQAALQHGDLHFRNILITEDLVSFIDFSNARFSLPHSDIANLWLANLPDHLATGDGAQGQAVGFGGVAQSDWTAFEAGYGARFTEDPLFRFLFLHRLYRSWLRLPAPGAELQERDSTLLSGVETVFDWFQRNHTD